MIEKIPDKVFQKLTELAADSDKDFYINTEKSLEEQKLSEEAKDLISLIYYNYIVDENEKAKIMGVWKENE